MITPSAPPSGTSTSAVTENDLFLMLTTLFSERRPMPGKNSWESPRIRLGRPGDVGVEAFAGAVVDREHVVLGGLDEPEPLQLGQHLRMLGSQVAGLAVVAVAVVQLPDVVVERRQSAADHDPRGLVLGDRAPALVVDPAVAEHLEVLQVVPLGRVRLVEGVQHAGALHRRLQHAVDHGRLGQPGRLQDRWAPGR